MLGWAAPEAFAILFPAGIDDVVALNAVGQLGLLFLLVLAGLETDLDLIHRRASATTIIAAGSILVPFLSGFALGWIVPATYLARPETRLLFALFFATALSISVVPVIACVLIDLAIVDQNPAQVLLAAALVNDAVGWLLLSLIASAAQRGTLNPRAAIVTVTALVGFLVVAFTIGQWIVDTIYVWTRPGLPIGHLSTLVLLALGAAALAEGLSIEAFLGAFVIGVLVGRTGQLDSDAGQTFETVTLAVLAPIFFATAGLRANLTHFDPLRDHWVNRRFARPLENSSVSAKPISRHVGVDVIQGILGDLGVEPLALRGGAAAVVVAQVGVARVRVSWVLPGERLVGLCKPFFDVFAGGEEIRARSAQLVARERHELVCQHFDTLVFVVGEMRIRPPLGGFEARDWDMETRSRGRPFDERRFAAVVRVAHQRGE